MSEELFSKFKDEPELETIHISRLLEVLQAAGRNPSYKEYQQRINELENDEKFELTYEDLQIIFSEPWTQSNSDRDELRHALSRFSHHHSGFIDVEQFRSIMQTSGEPLSDDETDELIQLGLNDEHRMIEIEHLLDQLLEKQ